MRRAVLAIMAMLGLGLAGPVQAQAPVAAVPGLEHDVVLPDYPALAQTTEILRRFLTPLGAELVRRRAAATGQPIAPRTLDPTRERFAVYVPKTKPASGYGLLVFVPPWKIAGMPRDWAGVLDKAGVIYVSAAASGNEESVLTRRAPLALVAYANMVRRYPIDPNRVYVGGFSGGARVAEKIALAYPEIFKAALIHSSADPVGSPELALPPAELWRIAQTHSRLVFLTGSSDQLPREMAEKTTRSLRHWCLYDSESQLMPWRGHTTANAAAFAEAFAALENHAPDDPAQRAACLADRQRDLEAALTRARTAAAGPDKAAARREILALDGAFGGLAAPAVLELADRCGCGVFDSRTP